MLATAANAQEPATFPVERFKPAINRDGIIDVEWGVVGEHLTYDAAFGIGYAHNPLLLYRRSASGGLTREGALVQHRLSADLMGALSLFEWVEVGLHVPITLYQGRGPPTVGAAPDALEAVGLGDLRLVPKVQVLNAADHWIDVALMASVTFPTGVPTQNYMGEKTVTFVPEVIVSRKLPGLRLATNLGYRLRDTTRQLGVRVGSEITYRFGAAHRLDYVDVPLEIGLSLSGSMSAVDPGRSFNRNPLEVLLAGTYDLSTWGQVYLGTGVGIIAGYSAPDVRVFAGFRFAPRSGDRDQDTIRDAVDPCPTVAEDTDSWEDEDGCPEDDNDGDGVPDLSDGAPFEPEDADGFEDGDGVPEPDDDGDGLFDRVDKCPRQAEDFDAYEDGDGCPDLDRDKDGVRDEVDACPQVPEDKDSFEDIDGCPEEDNDADGLADIEDKCAGAAETINNYEDNDGCPDVEPAVKVKFEKHALDIYGKVYFDSGKSIIMERSFDLLRQAAKLLRDNPEIRKLQIEGHTDSMGNAEGNRILSQDRADAVRRFLIKEGVDANRLVAAGFGQTQPIASNTTERGRSLNRRVAFTILEMAGGGTAPRKAEEEAR